MSDLSDPTPEQVILQQMQQRIIDLEARYTQQTTELLGLQAIASRPVQVTQTASQYTKEPKISSPPVFAGRKQEATEFLLKCDTVFNVQNRTYSSDQSKLAFVTNLLKDEAYHWVMPHLLLPVQEQPAWINNWVLFKEEFRKAFGDSDIIETSRQKLKALRQTQSATSYATEFTRHSAYLHWGDEALRHTYFDGLKEDVKDRLLTPNTYSDLHSLVTDSVKWDNLLFQRRRTQPTPVRQFRPDFNKPFTKPYTLTLPQAYVPVPMEVDGVRPVFKPLTADEKETRIKNNLCLYCGKAGHQVRDCRAKPSGGQSKN
jgi:hypothetical protein